VINSGKIDEFIKAEGINIDTKMKQSLFRIEEDMLIAKFWLVRWFYSLSSSPLISLYFYFTTL
jgi:hypothetical protein